jgi:hypothetical protein
MWWRCAIYVGEDWKAGREHHQEEAEALLG